MCNIDTLALREAVDLFVLTSRPSNADGSAKCSNNDLNKVIDKIASLLNTFIEELEN